MEARKGNYSRTTGETEISVTINLDGTGESNISSGNGVLDHMINQLTRHGLIDIELQAKGDSALTGWHHTVEDCGIALGRAFSDALGNGAGIRRMGHALVPLDEALARVALDLSGRGYAAVDLGITGTNIADLPGDLLRHFLESFAVEARMTLHINVLEGINAHHRAEAAFKGLAKALRDATGRDERSANTIPSTKGSIS
ncbi:MAG TPA: imidazoleglycerol-phosphate dehydratase HisB [Dehalococcoidia bacterium]|jgi:imidazoleglycerol-phosphate dehydratase|nr:imidazoleglycerol-phosphate dehydratase HisB [Dehalococcoidia bacterium]|tara:strand:+ start:251 stop:850 length:600 start_codon:yes stop_codon:yes gene_type:complete